MMTDERLADYLSQFSGEEPEQIASTTPIPLLQGWRRLTQKEIDALPPIRWDDKFPVWWLPPKKGQ